MTPSQLVLSNDGRHNGPITFSWSYLRIFKKFVHLGKGKEKRKKKKAKLSSTPCGMKVAAVKHYREMP